MTPPRPLTLRDRLLLAADVIEQLFPTMRVASIVPEDYLGRVAVQIPDAFGAVLERGTHLGTYPCEDGGHIQFAELVIDGVRLWSSRRDEEAA